MVILAGSLVIAGVLGIFVVGLGVIGVLTVCGVVGCTLTGAVSILEKILFIFNSLKALL